MPSIAEAKRALALYEAEGDMQNANLIREAIEEIEAPEREGIEVERARSLAQIERDRAFRARFAPPVEDPGLFENITSGFGAGAVSFGENTGLGAIALLDEEAELAARDKIKAAADYLRPEGGDPDSIAYNISSGLGSIAGAIGATGLVAGTASLAPVSLPTLGAIGTGTGILTGVAATAGEASERARAADATEEERNLAILKAAPFGALQAIPGARLLPKYAIKPLQDITNKIGSDTVESIFSRAAAKRLIGTGVIEAGEEAIQEIGQNLAARGYDPETEFLEGSGTAGAYGGAAGAIMELIMLMVPGGKRRASEAGRPTEEEETAPPAPLLDRPEEESELIADETAVNPEVLAAAEETAVDPEVLAAAEEVSAPVDVEAVRAKLFKGLVFNDDGSLDDTVEGNVAEFLTRRAALPQEEQRALTQANKKADTTAPAVVEELTDAEVEAQLQEAGAAEAAAEAPALDTDAESDEGVVIDGQSNTTTATEGKPVTAGSGTGDADNIRGVGDGTVGKDTVATDTPVGGPVDGSGSGVGGTTAGTGEQRAPLTEERQALRTELFEGFDSDVYDDLSESQQQQFDQKIKAIQTPVYGKGKKQFENVSPNAQKKAVLDSLTTEEQQEFLYGDPTLANDVEILRKQVVDLEKGTPTLQDIEAELMVENAKLPIEAQRTPKQINTEARMFVRGNNQLLANAREEYDAQLRLQQEAEELVRPKSEFEQAQVDLDTARTTGTPEELKAAEDTLNLAYDKEFVEGKRAPESLEFKDVVAETSTLKDLSAADRAAIDAVTKTTSQKDRPKDVPLEAWQEQNAVRTYLEAGAVTGDIANGLTLANYDVSTNADKYRTERNELKAQPLGEAAFFRGMGKVEAQRVLSWANKNLSTEGKTKVQEAFDTAKDAASRSKIADKRTTTKQFKAVVNKDPKTLTDSDKRTLTKIKKLAESGKKKKSQGVPRDADEIAAANATRKKQAKIAVGQKATATNKAYYNPDLDEGINISDDQANAAFEADIATLSPKDQDAARMARKNDREAQQQAYNILSLPKNAIESLEVTPQQVIDAVLRNPSETVASLPYALSYLVRHHPNPVIKRYARKLLDTAGRGTTRIKVVENLTNDDGTPAAGIFDPKTNTITLDKDYGVNTHTILHETAHAGVSESLADPKAGTTKRLQKIYDETKDQLNSYYGSQSLDEFVAEFMANPKFRNELAGMSTTTSASVLQDVLDVIRNIFRRLVGMSSKKRDTDAVVDELIDAILAPAPENRDAGKLLMSIKEGKVPEVIKENTGRDAVRELKKTRSEALDKGAKFLFGTDIEDTSSKAGDVAVREGSGFLAGFLNMQALADQASSILGVESVADLDVAFQKQNARIARINSKLTATANDITRKLKKAAAANKNGEVIKTFDELTTDSTMDRVDPSKDSDYYKNNANKLAIWDAQRPAWNNLGPDGQAAYIQLRTAYEEIMDDMQAALKGRIKDAAGESADTKNVNALLKTIFDRSKIEPYFPLLREGDYWLKYYVKPTNGPIEVTVEAFESPAARDRAYTALEADDFDGYTITGIERKESIESMKLTSSDIPPTSFVSEIIKTLNASIPADTKEAKDKKQETIDGIVNDFIQSVPESSFLKAFRKRENKLGAADNAMRAFNVKGYGLARRVEAIKGAQEIRKIAQNIEEEVKAGVANGTIKGRGGNILLKEVGKRVELTLNPPSSWIDRLAIMGNKIAFFGTLGFSVAGALNNAASIPTVILPFLAGRTDAATAAAAMAMGAKFFTGSGLAHKVTPYGSTALVEGEKDVLNSYMPSIDNYYAADAEGQLQIREDIVDEKNYYQMPAAGGKTKSMSKKEFLGMMLDLVQESSDRSLLNRSLFADQLGLELAADPKASGLNNFLDKFNKWSALPFHTVERFNRQATIVGAFLNEMARLNTNPNKAKNEDKLTDAEKQRAAMATALHDTAQLNGGAGLNTAPRFAQSGIQRAGMMFKTYGFTMYYNQLMMAKAALKQAKENGLDAESIRIARKQFIASQGAVLALTGVQGLTIVGIAQGLADLFLYDDEEEDADALTRQYLGDPLYKGGVQYLTAFAGAEVDVATRIGLSNLILGNNKYDFNKSNKEEFVDLIGGPALGYASSIGRGYGDVMGGEMQRGVEAMSPAFLRNILQSVRFGQEGALTRRGDPITDDMNAGELTAKFFGYAPAKYSNAQERNQDLKKIDTTVSKRKSVLMKRYYIAIRMGEDPSDVMEEIMEHNQRHSGKGKEAVITPDSLKRSMKMHAKTSTTMYNGVTLSPSLRAYAEEVEDQLEDTPWFLNY